MRVSLATLGCKVNHYETAAMEELFRAAGWEVVPFGEAADASVINTCTVTATGDQKSRQLISRAHSANPGALIAVVGCYAQTAPQAVKALPGVGLVLGTDGRKDIVSRVEAALSGRDGDYVGKLSQMRAFEELSAIRDGRTRATLKIQDGCVNFCSYCIIPYARGPLRSRSLESIQNELRLLAREGYKEVVLTGIHLASYGRDSGQGDLLDVLDLAQGTEGIVRVRLGSLEPGFVDERFAARAAGLTKLCDQFHLSLQSGSEAVLSRMKRRYAPEAYLRSVALLRQALPGCAVTTDVIAGFPGETEAEHTESLAFCKEAAFSRMHVFPYSPRPGTAAAAMPGQLPQAVKQRRARELIRLGKSMTQAYLDSMLGRTLSVLAEDDGTGFAPNYVRVRVSCPPGEIRNVAVAGREAEVLFGKELD